MNTYDINICFGWLIRNAFTDTNDNLLMNVMNDQYHLSLLYILYKLPYLVINDLLAAASFIFVRYNDDDGLTDDDLTSIHSRMYISSLCLMLLLCL